MPAPEPAPPEPPRATMRAYLVMVAVGAFATTFAQERATLGNYPILFHLKERLHFSKEQVSELFMWATFAWNLPPLAGVLTDAFPIRGSRRRGSRCWAGGVAGTSGAARDRGRDDTRGFLLGSFARNAGLVLASTS